MTPAETYRRGTEAMVDLLVRAYVEIRLLRVAGSGLAQAVEGMGTDDEDVLEALAAWWASVEVPDASADPDRAVGDAALVATDQGADDRGPGLVVAEGDRLLGGDAGGRACHDRRVRRDRSHHVGGHGDVQALGESSGW